MYTEEKLRRINKVIKDMVFTYEGQILIGFDWKTKFDYQFQIKGVRQMISVGELYDYLMVDVTIIDGDKMFLVSAKLMGSSFANDYGFKNNLSDYYNQWDLLIAPSSNEAFGLVAIEAYSHGCAVAVFNDGGGLAELVSQCELKMVFNSTDELTAFIESLIEKSIDINETMLRNHRKAFAQKFSIAQMESSIKQVYLSL